jgi:hypothetical protein
MPGGRLKVLKDIVKRLTGAHLEASFGIVPFVADIVQTYTSLTELEYKIKILRRYAGRKQKRHFKRAFSDLPESITSGFPLEDGWQWLPTVDVAWPSPYNTEFRPPLTYYQKWVWIQPPIYHAQIEYIYSIPAMTEAEASVLAHLDALGLKLDPSIIWNAIPYTFLIDWIADVSGFLKTFSRDNFPVTVHAVVMTHSVSYAHEGQISVGYNDKSSSDFSPVPTWYYSEFHSPRNIEEAYRGTRYLYERRVVGDPRDISRSLSINSPNARQLALSGSLLVNKGVGGHGPTRASNSAR